MTDPHAVPPRLSCAVVLRVHEDRCQVLDAAGPRWVGYARPFPTPHIERVSPGHLVAVAIAADGSEVIVWRWYDAVVLAEHDDATALWEPAHGEVTAQRRPGYTLSQPGSRAYLSAGLAGAEWWVTGPVAATAEGADVDLDEVTRLYTDHDLWDGLV